MGMTVRVKQHPTGLRKMMGWYGEERKYPGDVFEIKEKHHFSKHWMEEVKASGKSVSVDIDLKG